MNGKYMSTGTATFTANTRTVTAATMSAAIDATDIGRVCVFRIGAALYWAAVSKNLSASSFTLHKGTLPAVNGTIDALFILDQGEVFTFDDYVQGVKTFMQGEDEKLTDTVIKECLSRAVTDYGQDVELTLAVKIAGDGTKLYNLSSVLGSFWKFGSTHITEIEYPSGQVPPEKLHASDWQIYDDGTAQDGSNLQIMFVGVQPAATEFFIVRFTYDFNLPAVGSANYPNTKENYSNITLLAAVYCSLALAAAYAPTKSSTITADVVNYSEKSDKYLRLARELLLRYRELVFGDAEGSQNKGATREVDHDPLTTLRTPYLFHGRGRVL